MPAVTETPQDTHYEVRNGGRKVAFVGRLLSHVSSERPHAPRWTDMDLYRTTKGLYVIHRVGVSKVYHTSDCPLSVTNRLPFGHELPDGPPGTASLQSMAPCDQCMPLVTDPSEQLRFERDRNWAGIAETADAAVGMLYRTDNGTRSLPWIAANLLNEASRHDSDLARAYATENI